MIDPDFPNVNRGDRDDEGTNVRKIQYLLRDRGFSLGIDGIFGPETDGKVRQFQQSNALAVDGIVGPKTWSRLIVQIQRGSTGDAVRAVQSQLTFLAVDGDFGNLTDNGVRGFQNHSGIEVDGIVGHDTWLALTLSPIITGEGW